MAGLVAHRSELRETRSNRWATGPFSLFSDQFLIKMTLVSRYSSGSVRYSLNTDLREREHVTIELNNVIIIRVWGRVE